MENNQKIADKKKGDYQKLYRKAMVTVQKEAVIAT